MEKLFDFLAGVLKNTQEPVVLVTVVCLFALAVVYGCVVALTKKK